MVALDRTIRHRNPLWGLVAILGLAVFLWGLHYKLSLYHPAAIQHTAPAAKLLSQWERPTPDGHIAQRQFFEQSAFVTGLSTFSGDGDAFSFNADFDLSAWNSERVEPQPDHVAERHPPLSPSSPRGPPIAI